MTEIERGGCAEFERGGRDNEWSSKQLCSFPPVHPVPPNGKSVDWWQKGRGRQLKVHPLTPPTSDGNEQKNSCGPLTPHSSNLVPWARDTHIQTQSGTLIGCEPVDALLTHAPYSVFSFLKLTYTHSGYIIRKKYINCE